MTDNVDISEKAQGLAPIRETEQRDESVFRPERASYATVPPVWWETVLDKSILVLSNKWTRNENEWLSVRGDWMYMYFSSVRNDEECVNREPAPVRA